MQMNKELSSQQTIQKCKQSKTLKSNQQTFNQPSTQIQNQRLYPCLIKIKSKTGKRLRKVFDLRKPIESKLNIQETVIKLA
jgi:hypothetical protein